MRPIFLITIMTLCIFNFLFAQTQEKELKLAPMFSDHMVLQRNSQVNFWGRAAPEQKLVISGSWGKKVFTQAAQDGRWQTKLPTPKAGGPYTVTIQTSDSTIILNDLLVGEVWVASGQSNMDLPVKGWGSDSVLNSRTEIEKANYPDIRLIKVPFNTSIKPIESFEGKWTITSPETVGDFSATAYFYARKLYEELQVPIGIIQSSIGGTPAEAWTSRNYLEKIGDFNKTIADLEESQAANENWFGRWPVVAVPKSAEEWNSINFSDLEATKPDFDDSKWAVVGLPARFDRLPSGEFDGAVWFRRQFAVEDLTSDYILKIEAIDDMDATYINGRKIGGLVGPRAANAPREMIIPSAFLVKGKNTIAIRAIDTGGPGSISGEITFSNEKGSNISLSGAWKYQLIAELINGKFYQYKLETDISRRPDLSRINSNSPTVLFNAMINPIIPYTIRGAIWYQGESNVGRAEQYKRIFPNMIEDWRDKWGYQFPFYYVQIAPFLYTAADQKNQSQKLRDAQRYALQLPKTGMAVTLDVGNLKTAHPANKQVVGERLARFALANEYGKTLVTSGPLFKKVTQKGNEVLVEFESVGSGLSASPEGLSDFEVAGANKVYFPAEARIVNNKAIVVKSASVPAPVYVRYAWSDGSSASLFNREGLPASTFSSER